MTDALLNTLLDYGALGLFAGFMVWQHLTMTKRQHEDQKVVAGRADAMQTRFEEKLSELAEKYETREEALRERYDSVVKDYQERNEEVRESVLHKLSDLDAKMTTGLGEMRAHYQEAKLHQLAKAKGGGK
jgi:DNA anti-recombination protein RmuC|tara:strand:- start:969 stop:1358 length:390 start_codon:yes stop_codon:yes gene_type:complete